MVLLADMGRHRVPSGLKFVVVILELWKVTMEILDIPICPRRLNLVLLVDRTHLPTSAIRIFQIDQEAQIMTGLPHHKAVI